MFTIYLKIPFPDAAVVLRESFVAIRLIPSSYHVYHLSLSTLARLLDGCTTFLELIPHNLDTFFGTTCNHRAISAGDCSTSSLPTSLRFIQSSKGLRELTANIQTCVSNTTFSALSAKIGDVFI
ncbi:hypothetical protein TNCV_4351021 [Trichonephila clavipes]|nr:hypothetical protein TNCV_4351021 [Trichonephila clavipes]